MADPPPVPAASPTIPPPLMKMAFVLGSGFLTMPAISFLTTLWAKIEGQEGIVDQVAIIFDMSGDGTLSPTGVLTVTKTNGVSFGPFATGTDAADLTGTLDPARIAAGSLPYAKLEDALGASLLGADAAGPIVAITIGDGLVLAGGVLKAQGPAAVAVASLGSPTAGARAFVNDANATTFGTIVAGGGANFVPVYGDGANWRIG